MKVTCFEQTSARKKHGYAAMLSLRHRSPVAVKCIQYTWVAREHALNTPFVVFLRVTDVSMYTTHTYMYTVYISCAYIARYRTFELSIEEQKHGYTLQYLVDSDAHAVL